jgi:two-component system OmpR family response regulator
MSTVLVVEDDPHTRELVRMYLDRDGHQVLTAENGLEGLDLARSEAPDIVLLDLMMPVMNGWEVCQALRQDSDVPIVMVTAMVEEDDRLAGFDLGADDYITKPFSPREVVARVRAILRRAARDRDDTQGKSGQLTWGAVSVDMRAHEVTVSGAPVKLTPTEFRLLAMFVKQPGRVFERDQIIERSFGYDYDGFDRTVDVHISGLRRKLEKSNGGQRIIHTVYGVGYKFGDG